MKKILIITGSTGTGKTAVSIEVAKKIGGEIISADSMQIYKDMDIGTAKVRKEEMQNIPHYMIDIVEPDKEFSVAEYKNMSEKIIEDIISRGKTPMFVGGTGLYLNSFIFDRDYNEVAKDEKFREEMEQLDNSEIYNLLIEKDSEAKELIHQNNRKRIIRALEIMEHGGEKLSVLRKNLYKPSKEYDAKIFFIERNREKLYSMINERVDMMMEEGLEEEVRGFYEKGFTRDLQSMHGIGYREFFDYFEGKISREEVSELIKRHSRNYAKRQITFFKKIKNINMLSADELSIDEIADIITDKWREYERRNN